MSIAAQNTLAFGLQRIELAAPHRPREGHQDGERECDRQRDEKEQDIHGYR